LLNTICDRALLGAYATGQTRVKETIVRRAAREVLGPRKGRRWLVATATATMLLVAGGVFALYASGALPSLGGWPLPRVGTNGPAPAGASLAAAVPEPRIEEPTLATILGDPTVTADLARAITNLYALWNLDVRTRPGDPGCEIGRTAGLRCLFRTGTWNVLRRFNLPAILELSTPDGKRHHVVLTGLDGERATLQIAELRVTLPTVEVERFWDGAFLTVWKSPIAGPLPLQLGMRGRDIVWLREQFAAIDGRRAPATAGQTYDEELRRRVAAFQQVESLTPDGIAGEETLVRLAALTPGGNGPSLTRMRP
jgi:general secretion pathway protein A